MRGHAWRSLRADSVHGLIYFGLYRSASPKERWTLLNKLLVVMRTDRPHKVGRLRERARFSGFRGLVEGEKTRSQALFGAWRRALLNQDSDRNRQLIKAVGSVSERDALDAIRTWVAPLFDDACACTAIACAPAKVETLRATLLDNKRLAASPVVYDDSTLEPWSGENREPSLGEEGRVRGPWGICGGRGAEEGERCVLKYGGRSVVSKDGESVLGAPRLRAVTTAPALHEGRGHGARQICASVAAPRTLLDARRAQQVDGSDFEERSQMNNEKNACRARGNRTFEGVDLALADSSGPRRSTNPCSARKFCWEMACSACDAAWRFDLGALCDVKSAASVIH